MRQQAKRDRTDAATAVPSWLRAGRTPMEALRAEAARVEWLHRDGGGHHRPYPLVITADARVYRRAGPASASDRREHAASGAVLSCWKIPAPSGGTVWNGGDSSRCPVGLRIGRAYSRPCAEPTPGCTVLVLIGGTLPPLAPLVLKRPAAPPAAGRFTVRVRLDGGPIRKPHPQRWLRDVRATAENGDDGAVYVIDGLVRHVPIKSPLCAGR